MKARAEPTQLKETLAQLLVVGADPVAPGSSTDAIVGNAQPSECAPKAEIVQQGRKARSNNFTNAEIVAERARAPCDLPESVCHRRRQWRLAAP